jgi:hypothetical protein
MLQGMASTISRLNRGSFIASIPAHRLQHKRKQLKAFFPRSGNRSYPLRLFYELFRRVLCAVISNANGWSALPESEYGLEYAENA